MKTIRFFVSSLATLLVISISARAQQDILDYAKSHPGTYYGDNGKPLDGYGNPGIAEAAKKLADIPHPWTVPKIIEIYDRESESYLRNIHEMYDLHQQTLGPVIASENERCGYLATILAASGDPRAVVALSSALHGMYGILGGRAVHIPWGLTIYYGLYENFILESRYKQLPVDPNYDGPTTNMNPRVIHLVDAWWDLNKEEIIRDAN